MPMFIVETCYSAERVSAVGCKGPLYMEECSIRVVEQLRKGIPSLPEDPLCGFGEKFTCGVKYSCHEQVIVDLMGLNRAGRKKEICCCYGNSFGKFRSEMAGGFNVI
jgi:hypothetical protein